MIRAKFKVVSVTKNLHWDSQKGALSTIRLTPVTSNSDENKAFFEATPTGQLDLGVLGDDVAANFKLGGEYYVDFTPAAQ